MLRRYKKLINQYFSRSRIIIIACIIITIFLSINLVKEVLSRHQIDEKIKQYKIDVTKLESENKEITQFIDSWTTSRQLEKEARLKFGLRKPGENVILITRNSNQNNNTINSDSEILGRLVVPSVNNYPNYINWLKFFSKK